MKDIVKYKETNCDQYRRIFSLFILVFEGFGIRMLNGIVGSPIILWTALLVLLNFRQINKIPFSAILSFLLFCLFYLGFCSVKGIEIKPFLFAAWVSAFCVISNYTHNLRVFMEDLYLFTKLCVYYDLLHVVAYIILKPLLFTTNFGMNPNTILYIFYFNRENGLFDIPRIQGFCWEPSCWICLLNLNLALVLLLQKPRKEIILSVMAIISVFSTTGFLTMIFVFVLYFILYNNKTNIGAKIIIVLIFVIVFPIAKENFTEKFASGSGATRYGDFYVAEYVLRKSPLLGGDMDNITSNVGAMNAKRNNWGYYDASVLENYDGVGMTNAFAALFVEWGLPITLLLFYLMYMSPLFPNRKMSILVSGTILVVLMGTPIARTGFFYMFPLSTLIIYKPWKKDFQSSLRHIMRQIR